MNIPTPKPSDRWSVDASTPTQILLVNKHGMKLAIELQEKKDEHYLLAAAVDRRISAAVFRAALPELFPDVVWGKLPRHSSRGLRAVAKMEKVS